jgi:GntR family transcriptional regulator
MLLRIDTQSGVPIYQQIVAQVRRLIAGGTLAPGDRLPTVRELAAGIMVNPNTVARAYQDLEREGVVETRRGSGTFACAPSQKLTSEERNALLAERLDALITDALTVGIPLEDVPALWQERVAAWRERVERES